MMGEIIAIIWFVLTIILYLVMKVIYQRFRKWWLMPMLVVPAIIITILIIFNAAYTPFYAYTHWLVWMLGPATVSFAIPIYERRKIIYRHWPLLCIGVVTGVIVSVGSSLLLAKLFNLSDQVQASLVTRSISTPFAMIVAPKIGGSTDLAAIFVILTGVFGMVVGQIVLALLPIKSHLAKGALFGAAAHVCGTTKAMELHQEMGVVASLVMILSGIVTVLIYPLLTYVLG